MEQSTVVWGSKPVWDDQQRGWCWRGTQLQGTGTVPITRFLETHEFDPESGYPLANLQPPSSIVVGGHTPRSGDFNQAGYTQGQQSLSYPLSASPSQTNGNYYLESGSLNQGRLGQEELNYAETSTSNRSREKHGHHKRSRSDKKSSSAQLPADLEGSIPQDGSGGLANGTGFTTNPTIEAAYAQGSRYGSGGYRGGLQSIPERPGGRGGEFIRPGYPSPGGGGGGGSGGSGYYDSNQPSSSFGGNNALMPQNTGFAGPLTEIRVNHKAEKRAPWVDDRNNGRLDENYKMHQSWEFQAGKIISIMWYEPKGANMKGPFGSRITHRTVAEHRKSYWSGFRRFLIIRNHEGHCTAVPIYTYQQQGCNKPGVKHYQHGVIYEDGAGRSGALLPGEKPLGFAPVRARTTTGDILDDASRVNYSKLASIPHNKEISFLAEVLSEDWHIVIDAVRSFFELSSKQPPHGGPSGA